MNPAIAYLQTELDVLRNNEPIHRSEGNIAQADLCLQHAQSIEDAIADLQGIYTDPA